MRNISVTVLIALLSLAPQLGSQEKPTSLSDARAAVEANLRTPEGKLYDQKLGTEFVQTHLAAVRKCKQSAGEDPQSFWFLLKLGKDGAVSEVLLYPETKLGACSRIALLNDKFPPPPKPGHWVSIYLKLSH